jgi:hypothetical protein
MVKADTKTSEPRQHEFQNAFGKSVYRHSTEQPYLAHKMHSRHAESK